MSRRTVLVCLIAAVALTLSAQQPRGGDFAARLVAAAQDRPSHPAHYDPGYVKIAYPNGDVPADSGVCTDEIIRIYRAVGIDLQKEVHEDMDAHRSAYPYKLKWMQLRLDTNIDHRRVPNLAVFFARKGQSLSVTNGFEPGDIVVWMLPSGRDHIGMVVKGNLVEHNIGEGPKIEDVLFAWKIAGHYRYRPQG